MPARQCGYEDRLDRLGAPAPNPFMTRTGNVEARLASRRMICRVVTAALLLLVAGETTASANCGGYVVVVGGARLRQSHGALSSRLVDAPRQGFLLAGSRRAMPSSRTPCSSGECQGRTHEPYSPPPIVVVHSPLGGDALAAVATAASGDLNSMRLSLAAFHWVDRNQGDEIFKPPR